MWLRPTIYQANKFIEAQKSFTIHEERIMYLALAKVMPILPKTSGSANQRKNIEEVYIPRAEVIKQFGGNKAYYKLLQKACLDVRKKGIEIHDEKTGNFISISVFEYVHWIEKGEQPGLYIKFTASMWPFIKDLQQGHYTLLMLKFAFALRSSTSLKILEMMMKVRKQAHPVVSMPIQELKCYLGTKEGAYEGRVDIFRRNVLQKSLDEIEKTVGITIYLEAVKEGKTITGFTFSLKKDKK